MILRCTGKLLRLLRISTTSLAEGPSIPDEHQWYANLLWFDRRKCLLLTHAETFFSVFVPDIRKADLTPVGPFVVAAIEDALASEDLPRETFGDLDPHDVILRKTASRVVLGCMNELARLIEYDVIDQSQSGVVEVDALNHRLRRIILGPLGLRYPIDLAAERALRLRGMSTN
jgi:hypothetical protein